MQIVHKKKVEKKKREMKTHRMVYVRVGGMNVAHSSRDTRAALLTLKAPTASPPLKNQLGNSSLKWSIFTAFPYVETQVKSCQVFY
jgi:hypothetical protein